MKNEKVKSEKEREKNPKKLEKKLDYSLLICHDLWFNQSNLSILLTVIAMDQVFCIEKALHKMSKQHKLAIEKLIFVKRLRSTRVKNKCV